MVEHKPAERSGLTSRLLAAVAVLAGATLAGLYLGRVTVSNDMTRVPDRQLIQNAEDKAARERKEQEFVPTPGAPPLFFHAGFRDEEGWKRTAEQVAMSAAVGIHQYMAPLSLVWEETPEILPEQWYAQQLDRYVAKDFQAQFLLQLNLNPPVSWLEARPEEAMRVNDVLQAVPSAASAVWRESALRNLRVLVEAMENGPHASRIRGYVLTGLIDQNWFLPSDYDTSAANQRGFQEWLRNHYGSIDRLREKWGVTLADFSEVVIPARPEPGDFTRIFLEVPEMQPVVDFLRYSSESVAEVIAAFAACVAEHSTTAPLLLAAYGHTYEAISSASGHFALERLLKSPLTGFITPVSYYERGLGGVGAVMGPSDSLSVRGRQWYLLDDTRTGIERDPATGVITRIRGMRAEDVYEVQRRNFAFAMIHDLALVWSDPNAEGWFADADQWTQFAALRDIYSDYRRRLPAPAGEDKPYNAATMTIVVDEESRFFQQCDNRFAQLLQRNRNAALRTGVSARFHLLNDVIEGIAPPTPVYLFLNVFHLLDAERERLHARLAEQQASAIWIYAPGYFNPYPSTENISRTTGMDVRAFDEPVETGTEYALTAKFLQPNQIIGMRELVFPLFYIEQNDATDVLGTYAAAQRPSVAMITLDQGWTSVYIAEPEINAALLCEILSILEQPTFMKTDEQIVFDAVFARNDLVAVHAAQAGRRGISFGKYCDIQDLFLPSKNWAQKESIVLSTRVGETRLLLQIPGHDPTEEY